MRIAKTMIASSATGPRRLALPMIPWMRVPQSNRLSRDQYSMGSSAFPTTKPGRIGACTRSDTHSSNRSESAITHLRADAAARTSSRQVRTLPTKSA
jgi:hypothetical protein